MSLVFDCKWGSWNEWSQYSETCGNGTKTRSRRIIQEAAYEGKECEGNNTENIDCTATTKQSPMPVIGPIIGSCLVLIIILMAFWIYKIHQKKSHQNDLVTIKQKGNMLRNLAHEENLDILPGIEKSHIEIGNFLGIYHNF